MKFKNYKNSYNNDNRIYSRNDLLDMSLRELGRRKKELLAQYDSIGIPNDAELSSSSNVIHVNAYTRDDGTEVKAHWRSKPNSGSAIDGQPTGCAAKIDRTLEIKDINDLPKNNDDFFENERNKKQSWLMRINAEQNDNRPDAKLFMDIALIGPKQIPSTQDYQFVSPEIGQKINEKYKLTNTNKEIPRHYDGFVFNANSPTAERLNNSQELKEEIFAQKNYNTETGKFKTDKLEINFQKDKNLQYSFGHMTILNPKIENGYVTGLGFDKYDYDWWYLKYKGELKTRMLNDSAKLLQTSRQIHNYYMLIPIKVKI